MVSEIKNAVDGIRSLVELSGKPFIMPPEIIDVSSPLVMFPLNFQSAREYILPRVALLGDAAHSIHPMAGQGLNLGVADASLLVDVILEARNNGGDIGATSVLKHYEDERYKNNLAMMSLIDGLHRIFSTNSNILRRLRSIGMLGINGASLVRNEIAKFAMGVKF
jgi:2-polyprenyl-6-methoxyphenol hydroxylase-like FAD-dependent oxidoreductase